MPSVNSAFGVSGLSQVLPGQNIGQLSAASSTSGSLTTASAGEWMIEEQSLEIHYRRVPLYGFNTDHTLSLSGYALATEPTAGTNASVHSTRLIYHATANYTIQKVNGAFAGSYSRPQTFHIVQQSAGDDGGDGGSYGHEALSGTLGPAGMIFTSATYYNRRPWAGGDKEINQHVEQYNMWPSLSGHPYMSEEDQAIYTSSITETDALFHAGKTTYIAYNENEWISPGLPSYGSQRLYVGPSTGIQWGSYDPGQETLAQVASFINTCGNHMKGGNGYTPTMIPHPYTDQYGNAVDLHRITQYDSNRHSFV